MTNQGDISRAGLESHLSWGGVNSGAEELENKQNNNNNNFLQVVPNSAFWTSIDMMINYFKQNKALNRLNVDDILMHLENTKKNGYELEKRRWKYDAEKAGSKGIMYEIDEARRKGELLPYKPTTVRDYFSGMEIEVK